MSQKLIKFSGKLANFRKTFEVNNTFGQFTMKTDKNYSVYEISPREVEYKGEYFDCLSAVRGQVPNAAENSLVNFIQAWVNQVERYSN